MQYSNRRTCCLRCSNGTAETSCKPLVILFLLALGVPIAALPVTMTNWSSLRPLIIVCSSGPFPKDVKIVFFPFLLDINIPLLVCVIVNQFPHWPLSASTLSTEQSNCGRQQYFAAKWQIIQSLLKSMQLKVENVFCGFSFL